MNVGKIIEESILDYFNTKYRGCLPHPAIVTKLCSIQELSYYWEEEIPCQKVSPLTLTGVIRGLKNKKKEKPVVEKEGETTRRIEQNPEPRKKAREILYLTAGTEPAGRSNSPIRNRPTEEEVVLRKENREELPLPPLYDGAGEEIPRSRLPSWHMSTPTATLRPTWGRTQGDEHIYIPQHTPPKTTGDGHEELRALHKARAILK